MAKKKKQKRPSTMPGEYISQHGNKLKVWAQGCSSGWSGKWACECGTSGASSVIRDKSDDAISDAKTNSGGHSYSAHRL